MIVKDCKYRDEKSGCTSTDGGVCNSAFRLTVKEFGAGLVCAEMVSDKAILLNNKRTLDMLYIDERKSH